MFTHSIRNIVQKQSNDNINILYYPNNSIVDDIIIEWGYNIFIPAGISRNKSIHKNVTYIKNMSLFEYDFVLSHHMDHQLMNMCVNLHIPAVQYLSYGLYNQDKIIDQPNLYYIAENKVNILQEKIITIIPDINYTNTNINEKICMIINKKNNSDLIQAIMSMIPNISLVDTELVDKKAMEEIVTNHNMIIDLYPSDIYRILFCAKNNVPYLTIKNHYTDILNDIYNGVYFIESNLEKLKQNIDMLLIKNNKFNINFIVDDKNNQILHKYLQKIKRLGLTI